MTGHSELLDRYRRTRDVRFGINHLLVKTIPKKTLEDCAKILGFTRKGVLVFESEHETSVLMDYCIYFPQPDGRNLVADYLEKSPPPADSEEMAALGAMTRAYYSLFEVVDVERGVGVSVRDLLRDEDNFLVDVGLGNTAERGMWIATRIIPMDGFLATGGAGLPLDATAAKRVLEALSRGGFDLETFEFRRMTPRQTAELAAIIIRECRSSGMTSRIAYAEPGVNPHAPSGRAAARRVGRNDPCPCGSGKKFKVCCGRNAP